MTDKNRKRLPQKKEQPPMRDGWIELSPGATVSIDDRLDKHWHEQAEKIKELRGRVLAVCIQIELELDSILRALFFPEHILKVEPTEQNLSVSDLSLLFSYEVVKDLGFSQKYRILKKLITRHKLLENKDFGPLLAQLDEVRKVRNLFAHSAISFVPIGDPPNQELQAEGYSDGRRVVIDDKFIAHCERIFGETMQSLDTLLREITPPGQSVQPSTNE
jgi:hypothetical protein